MAAKAAIVEPRKCSMNIGDRAARISDPAVFPPYAFVPGRFPHPISDPAGHSFGAEPHQAVPLDPANWQASAEYLRGIELFDHGYYWESHEVWESLWHAAGRTGPIADFLKGLIALAAAGVKSREGKAAGVVSHAGRAGRLFCQVAESLSAHPDSADWLGWNLTRLIRFANEVADEPPMVGHDEPMPPVEVVFPSCPIPRKLH
jgi:hypothetical protein